jgi:hypothetical protein
LQLAPPVIAPLHSEAKIGERCSHSKSIRSSAPRPARPDRVRLRAEGRALVVLKTVWRDGMPRFLFAGLPTGEDCGAQGGASSQRK